MAWDTFKAALKRHCEGGIAIPGKEVIGAGPPSKENMRGKYEGIGDDGIGDDGIGDDGKREKRTLAARAFGKKKGNWPGHRRIIDKSGLEHRGNIKAIDREKAMDRDTAEL